MNLCKLFPSPPPLHNARHATDNRGHNGTIASQQSPSSESAATVSLMSLESVGHHQSSSLTFPPLLDRRLNLVGIAGRSQLLDSWYVGLPYTLTQNSADDGIHDWYCTVPVRVHKSFTSVLHLFMVTEVQPGCRAANGVRHFHFAVRWQRIVLMHVGDPEQLLDYNIPTKTSPSPRHILRNVMSTPAGYLVSGDIVVWVHGCESCPRLAVPT